MAEAVRITPKDIFFDPRALLKCRWGCEDFFVGFVLID
jgi:predicted metal-binding protein